MNLSKQGERNDCSSRSACADSAARLGLLCCWVEDGERASHQQQRASAKREQERNAQTQCHCRSLHSLDYSFTALSFHHSIRSWTEQQQLIQERREKTRRRLPAGCCSRRRRRRFSRVSFARAPTPPTCVKRTAVKHNAVSHRAPSFRTTRKEKKKGIPSRALEPNTSACSALLCRCGNVWKETERRRLLGS